MSGVLVPSMRVVLPRPAPHQVEKLADGSRFKIWVAGRRARKSSTALEQIIAGGGPNRTLIGALQGGNCWWVAPSHRQGTSIWRSFRGILSEIALEVNEQERRILLPGGGAISMKSAESVATLVGDHRGVDALVADECSLWAAEVYYRYLSPILSDRRAWAFFVTTPNGDNWFKSFFDGAASRPNTRAWCEPSTVNPFFDPAEIDRARAEGAPETTIEEQFLARFVSHGHGRTYHEFDCDVHLREFEHDPTLTLDLSASYKISPPAWVASQGNGTEAQPERALCELSGNTTRDLVAAFRARFPSRRTGRGVRVFGDVSSVVDGKSVGYSDYAALRAEFPNAQFMVQRRGVDVKDLTNAVNSVLRTIKGEVLGYVSPTCTRLVRDLEFTRNVDASFRVKHEPGLGHHALAWGLKCEWDYSRRIH